MARVAWEPWVLGNHFVTGAPRAVLDPTAQSGLYCHSTWANQLRDRAAKAPPRRPTPLGQRLESQVQPMLSADMSGWTEPHTKLGTATQGKSIFGYGLRDQA